MTHSYSRAAVLIAGLLLTAVCQAQSPQIGAWRKVSDAQLDKQFRFSMLPAAAPVASKWAAYDAQAGKVVCCLVVQGETVTEAELEGTYDIPGPWITDLTNGWNLDAAPYRPRVQLLRAEGALDAYEFAEMADALGGLLVPGDARAVAKDALEIGGQRYTVARKSASLADDDGGVTTYSLRPAAGGAALTVEVPFATY
ncbi:hypothetical protein [Achromobacter ruhlandii]|uniref:hypothetical protein n=1 Tax=Achromobacter ruhlandii TaxID=72557 RepID=UPI001EED4750|nr:hypothetical protein [Achromobacter ruhlandii]MCZ8396814.1 hypothetical protein [Achromobacter ruhlandii]